MTHFVLLQTGKGTEIMRRSIECDRDFSRIRMGAASIFFQRSATELLAISPSSLETQWTMPTPAADYSLVAAFIEAPIGALAREN